MMSTDDVAAGESVQGAAEFWELWREPSVCSGAAIADTLAVAAERTTSTSPVG